MSSGHQRIKWRRNIAENFNRLSRVHERYRQTERRQTRDGRTTTYSEHEHEFTFAKNRMILFMDDPFNYSILTSRGIMEMPRSQDFCRTHRIVELKRVKSGGLSVYNFLSCGLV